MSVAWRSGQLSSSPDRRRRRRGLGSDLLYESIISSQFKCGFSFLLVLGRFEQTLFHFAVEVKKAEVAVELLWRPRPHEEVGVLQPGSTVTCSSSVRKTRCQQTRFTVYFNDD